MRCFFCETISEAGKCVELEKRESAHLFKTMRAKSGDKIELLDGKGTFAIAEIEAGQNIKIVSKKMIPEPEVKLHLFAAPPRKQKMDSLLKQCAETGVWSISPIFTERSVAEPEKDSVIERWKTLLKEACKQSKNPYLPIISPPTKLAEALRRVSDEGLDAYYGSPDAPDCAINKENANAAWFVGPEGGFSEKEEQSMIESGAKKLRIGPWTMRAETAAICGASLLIFQKSDSP